MHGRRAHGAGRPVHEHDLPGPHACHVAEEGQRGEESVDGRDGLGLVESFRHVRDGSVVGDRQHLGVRAARRRDRAEHAVAGCESVYTCSDTFDEPREVGAQHRMLRLRQPEEEAREARRAAAPRAVGGSNGARLDAHEHLVLADLGLVGLGDAHHVGCAVTFVDCGSHDADSSESDAGYWNTSSSGTPKTRAIWNAISSDGE